MEKKIYLVDGPLLHDHKRYAEGDPVELTDTQAAALQAVGVVKEPVAQPEVDTITRLVELIGELPPKDNKSVWTSDNKPKTEALEKLLGAPVSAAQRDEAWGLYQESE